MSQVAPQFLFDFGSPNAFLSHQAIPGVEERIGIKFEYIPVLLGGIYKATNNKPPIVTLVGIKNKLEFLDRETERFARRYGVTVPKRNPFSPVNTLALMRGAVAAQFDGLFERYLEAVYLHIWVEPKDMSDPRIAQEALTASGLDAARLFARAQDRDVKQRLLENTQSAVERGAFGVPTYSSGTKCSSARTSCGTSRICTGKAAPDDRNAVETFGGFRRRRRSAGPGLYARGPKKTTKQTARGRKQDRAKVAGGQKYEVSKEAKKASKSAAAVKRAVKKVGNVRKKVEKRLAEKRK